MDNIRFNKCQTPLEELELRKYPAEVREQFWDYINNVPFIRWMVSPDRPLVSELPRDEYGRAIIDVTKPPILEGTDYFRRTALTWQETGRYTHLKPNANPQSEFGRWLRDERKRSWEGYLNPDTGMWVTGDYYWMLNYCPMHLVVKRDDGLEMRTTAHPKFWDGQFLSSHYILQARQNKHHAAYLASRGKGKTTLGGAMLSKRFILGEFENNRKEIQCLVTAADKTKLIGVNQILSVFIEDIDFCAKNTQFASHRLKSSVQELTWQMGYKKSGSDVAYGSKNSVQGIISGVNQDKLNGSRGVLYIIEEAGIFKDLNDLYGLIRPSVEQGSSVFGEVVLYGTAGNEQSDFTAFAEMFYSPSGYNLNELENVFDKEGQGRKQSCFFYPVYMNYDDSCIDKDGNSNITKALLMVCNDRYKVKYGSSDINAITKRISQYPITPQEAIIRSQGNMFPVTELNNRLNQIDNNPNEYDDVYVGELVVVSNTTGKSSDTAVEGKYVSNGVEFQPTGAVPIRDFPTKDNKVEGALEIYELPQKNSDGKVPYDRYGASCLREGEKVNTLDGLKSIEDITLEDSLINIDGKSVSIIKKMCRPYADYTYTLKLAGIYDTTTFTWNHPIYCSTPERHYRHSTTCKKTGLPERYFTYDFSFKKAKDVCLGDVVKSPNLYLKELTEDELLTKWTDNSRVDRKIPNPLLKEDFWWLMGLIIGDGWCNANKNTIHICFNSREIDYISKAENIVNTVFCRKFTNCKDNGSCVEKAFSCTALNAFVSKEIGKGAENKQLSEWIKYIPHRLKKQLILGYLASDGCVSRAGAEFVSVSKKLLCDFQDIFFSLGIISNVTKLRNNKVHTLSGRECNVLEAYHLRVGNTYLKKIISWNPNDIKLKKAFLTLNDSHRRQDIFFSEDYKYIYFRIKNITKEFYQGNVYNFECDTHTYMCNYVPTHNCDPYDDDGSGTMSLGSIFIIDFWKDMIVAEYTGRKPFADSFYEQIRLLCLYYNCKCMYENNLKGVFSYFSTRNCTHLLADTPDYLRDKQLIKTIGVGNKSKGIRATSPIINYGFRLIRDWLLKPSPKLEKDAEGNEIEVSVPNLYNLRCRALIKELIQWNPYNNYDRVMALVQLMLYREEKMILYQGDVRETTDYSSGMGADDYWDRNYPGKKGREEGSTWL